MLEVQAFLSSSLAKDSRVSLRLEELWKCPKFKSLSISEIIKKSKSMQFYQQQAPNLKTYGSKSIK